MKFLAEDDRLIITLEGWEAVWSLRRKLVIPRAAIVSLAWTPAFTYTGERFFRLGGTGAPGMLYAGNFRGSSGWYFLFIRRPKGRNWLTGGNFKAPDILDITTQAYKYERLLLSCRPDIGVSLMDWFGRTRS